MHGGPLEPSVYLFSCGAWCKSGFGAKETKGQGLAGFRAPSRRRPRKKNGPGLGAKKTKEQGLGGFRAPSRRRSRRKNGARLGAKETEEQGLAVFHAPSRPPGAGLGRRPVTPTPTPAGGSTSPGPTPAASHFGLQPYGRPPLTPQPVVKVLI